ncbi:DUF4062 domain-containing protein [Bacteroidales bacterium OttesenSCG-928-K22]|nr:DUF4062 domain-containing protein [Bacteroidales bacterium OttesenSCG-928-L14]MDL2240210.1 DUF4062 domain-containing protein [Bacteroidales bacterium OttesenSCG-928-K22]
MMPIRIFISSVQSEFVSERKKLCNYIRQDALLGRFFIPFIFEELPATNKSVQQAYIEEVSSCDIYLGLFGKLYGYENKNGISPTEIEYDIATEKSKHRLYLAGYIERMGTGTRDIISKCKALGLKKPEFIQEEEFKIILWRETQSEPIIGGITEGLTEGLTSDVKEKLTKILLTLYQKEGIRISEIEKLTNIPAKSLERYIKQLKEANIIEFRGAKRTGGYYLNEEIKKKLEK